jgi:hypothetical protein
MTMRLMSLEMIAILRYDWINPTPNPTPNPNPNPNPKPKIKTPGSGKGDDDEIDESGDDSDPEVRLNLGVVMLNPFSRNELLIQATRWVDASILKCPYPRCRTTYAKGGTFSFNTHIF